MAVAPQIAGVAALLPSQLTDAKQLGGRSRPWLIGYGERTAVLRFSDPARLHRLRLTPDVAHASIVWLHDFLTDLERVGFVAPAPIHELGGDSVAVVKGVIWELLTFVPGSPMEWSGPMRDAGGLLARFHDASLRVRTRQQRPGALPIAECRPSNPDARRIRARLDHELAEVGYDRAERGVVHGDATQANVVIDGDAYHLVDYALVAVEPLLFDVASALWRNGRTAEASLDYDAQRSAEFVRGYHAVRPIVPDDARAIIAYMLGRGLQIERRHELRQGHDATIMQRLLAVERQADELRDAVARAVDGES